MTDKQKADLAKEKVDVAKIDSDTGLVRTAAEGAAEPACRGWHLSWSRCCTRRSRAVGEDLDKRRSLEEHKARLKQAKNRQQEPEETEED